MMEKLDYSKFMGLMLRRVYILELSKYSVLDVLFHTLHYSSTKPFGKFYQISTCFNRLDLPNYDSKSDMEEKLTFAISTTTGFGME